MTRRVFTTHEKDKYVPEPCPACGTEKPRVEWIDVTLNPYSPQTWIPGLRVCRKLGCKHSDAPAGIGGETLPDCPQCGSGVLDVGAVCDFDGNFFKLNPCEHTIPQTEYQMGP